MRPPLLGRALLALSAGEDSAEFVAGDLEQEFTLRRESDGNRRARRWYVRQVVTSVAPLISLRIRSGEASATIIAVVAGVGAPLLLLDRLWLFAFSQIPLKDSLSRDPWLLAVNLALVFAGAAASAPAAAQWQRAILFGLTSAFVAGLVVYASAAAAPPIYCAGVMMAALLGSLIRLRSWRSL